MRLRHPLRTHLVKPHPDAAADELPRGFTARESRAYDCDDSGVHHNVRA